MSSLNCLRWKSLFEHSDDPIQIYNDFLVDRSVLIEHLNNCIHYQDIFMKIAPKNDIIPNSSMTVDEFSKAIRELREFAKQKKRRV
jgi:hypothetical protein